MNSTKLLFATAILLLVGFIVQDRFLSRWDRYLSEVNDIRDGDPKLGQLLHFAVNREWQSYMRKVVQLDNDSAEKGRLEDEFLRFLKTEAPLPGWFEDDFRRGFHSDNGRYFFRPFEEMAERLTNAFIQRTKTNGGFQKGNLCR